MPETETRTGCRGRTCPKPNASHSTVVPPILIGRWTREWYHRREAIRCSIAWCRHTSLKCRPRDLKSQATTLLSQKYRSVKHEFYRFFSNNRVPIRNTHMAVYWNIICWTFKSKPIIILSWIILLSTQKFEKWPSNVLVCVQWHVQCCILVSKRWHTLMSRKGVEYIYKW